MAAILQRLKEAAGELRAGRAVTVDDGRLVARVVESFLSTPSRARDALVRQEGRRERDRLLAELARVHCSDIPEVRGKVRQVLRWADRYEAGAWVQEQHEVDVPRHRIGTPEALLWRALTACPDIPRETKLREIIAASMP